MRNIGRARSGWVALAAIVIGAGSFMSPPAAFAQSLMSDAEARRAIADSYGAEVLRVEATERDGVPVFILKVMNPAGDFDEAYQVNVLVMNRQTGQLVPQFRHRSSGATNSASGRRDVNENSGPVLRQGVNQ